MKVKPTTLPIPFDAKGNMMDWALYDDALSFLNSGGTWRTFTQAFPATMTFAWWAKGRSSVSVILKDSHGHTYSMIAGYFFEDVIPEMTKGVVTGHWAFIKRGGTYSLIFVGP